MRWRKLGDKSCGTFFTKRKIKKEKKTSGHDALRIERVWGDELILWVMTLGLVRVHGFCGFVLVVREV